MPPEALDHVPVWLLIGLLVVWVVAQAAHWLLPPLLEWVKYLDQRRRHDDSMRRRHHVTAPDELSRHAALRGDLTTSSWAEPCHALPRQRRCWLRAFIAVGIEVPIRSTPRGGAACRSSREFIKSPTEPNRGQLAVTRRAR